MDNSKPKVAEHATREALVLEDFLYLFFSQSETSQAARRAFWERRHARVDQDVPSSMAATGAQATAIAGWGVVPQTDRYARLREIKQPVLVVNGVATSPGVPALAQHQRPPPRHPRRPTAGTNPHPQRTPATLVPPEDPSGVIKPGERMWSAH
jgi:hypothetical protein